MAESGPSVIVLAGSNGAGKTTAAGTLLAETLRVMTFVNADVIAQGLAAFDPESVAIEAGRVMLERLQALAAQRADFAFETTLAGRAFAPWLSDLRASGYVVKLVCFWVGSADLAVARVAQRVSLGGHHVPEDTIRRRYHRSLKNFFHLYRNSVSLWSVYDSSESGTPRLIAEQDGGGALTIALRESWARMQSEVSA